MEQCYSAVVRCLIYSVSFFLFFIFSLTCHAQSYPIEEILVLLERGQFSSASQLLQTNLQLDSTDRESRILLGSLMESNGLRAEAIRLWQQGLQNNESDYTLLVSIGESYLREAELIVHEENAPSSLLPFEQPNYNYITYLDSAIATLKKATGYYPHESDALYMLAHASQLKGDYAQALQYARLLTRIFPLEEKNHTLTGLLLTQMGDYQAAEAALQASLSINSHYTPAQKAMAELLLMQNRTEEAAAFLRSAAFHDFIPSFIGLSFSDENYATYSKLSAAFATDNENALREIIADLLEDTSDESTCWLALAFWHQMIPADLDEIAWDTFTSRGLLGQRLMVEMARRTDNGLLLGKLCRKMVQMQIPGTFELLIQLLPQDRMMDSPLRIAYCLAALGNDLAVPYLIRELQYSIYEDDERGYVFSREGRQAARQRAVLALSYFNTATSIETLQKGLENQEIKPYCAVALYLLTMQEHYLEPLRQIARDIERHTEITHFLRFIGTREANQLVKMME
ncbi:tetratricopeptide repeat protein [Rhodoflexus sp.]